MLHIAILLRLIAFCFFWHLGRPQQIFDPKPEDRNVSAGTEVVFQCVYIYNPQLIPIWLVNDTYYTGSLPGHAINGTGLVVTTETSFNGTKYQCQVAALIENNFFPRSNIAILNVYGEDLLLYSNELKGPPITLLRFDKSLYLQWDINQSKLPYLDNYRLKISDYEGVKKPMYVNISANCINLLLYGQNTSQFDSIAVYELQICQDWECAYRRGERKPQNLVAINYSNPITASTEINHITYGDKLLQKLTCPTSIKEFITTTSNNTLQFINYNLPDNLTYFLESAGNGDVRFVNNTHFYNTLKSSSVDWLIIQERCGEDFDIGRLYYFGIKNLFVLYEEEEVIYPWDSVPSNCSNTLENFNNIESTSTFNYMETNTSGFSTTKLHIISSTTPMQTVISSPSFSLSSSSIAYPSSTDWPKNTLTAAEIAGIVIAAIIVILVILVPCIIICIAIIIYHICKSHVSNEPKKGAAHWSNNYDEQKVVFQ